VAPLVTTSDESRGVSVVRLPVVLISAAVWTGVSKEPL
jgi:hypothetical protein